MPFVPNLRFQVGDKIEHPISTTHNGFPIHALPMASLNGVWTQWLMAHWPHNTSWEGQYEAANLCQSLKDTCFREGTALRTTLDRGFNPRHVSQGAWMCLISSLAWNIREWQHSKANILAELLTSLCSPNNNLPSFSPIILLISSLSMAHVIRIQCQGINKRWYW